MRSNVVTLDAPIGGWNAYDSLDNMPPNCAVILDNLIPGAGTVDTRGGYIVFADLGTGEPVETIASLDADVGSLLVAASDGGLFTMTDAPVLKTSSNVTTIAATGTFLNDRWQTVNFREADEEGALLMVNGVDPAQAILSPYTSTTELGFIKGEAAEAPEDFIGVCKFKGRCFYWYEDDDSFWYTNAGAYRGNIARYPLGAIAQKGGKIVLITTWTQQDSGDGKDDFLVIVFSTGEIIIYQGDDPGGVGFFEMVGRYQTGEPLSIRGSDKYGADTILMTEDGYVALSTIVQQGRISDVPAFSRLITNAIKERTRYNSGYYGWDCKLFPSQGLFVFNVPLSSSGLVYEQHVMNTNTLTWCRFKDLDFITMDVHKDRLFGGTPDGLVLGLLEGHSDNGDPILFTGLPAFNTLGDGGNNKFLTACQVLSTHPNPELIDMTGWSDYNWKFPGALQSPTVRESATWSINPAAPPAVQGSYWNEDYWAVEGNPYTTKGWQNVSAYGYAVSVMIRFLKVNDAVSWRSTSIRFNTAGAQ